MGVLRSDALLYARPPRITRPEMVLWTVIPGLNLLRVEALYTELQRCFDPDVLPEVLGSRRQVLAMLVLPGA